MDDKPPTPPIMNPLFSKATRSLTRFSFALVLMSTPAVCQPNAELQIQLYAGLTDYLPVDRRRSNQMTLELPEGATIEQVVAPFHLPPKLVHLVLVNGHYIAPQDRATRALVEGDVLAIWPPIAGG